MERRTPAKDVLVKITESASFHARHCQGMMRKTG
jgi:hypothetical protein